MYIETFFAFLFIELEQCHNFHLLMLTLFCTMLAHMTEAGLRENQESSEVSIFQKILKLIKFSLSNLTI